MFHDPLTEQPEKRAHLAGENQSSPAPRFSPATSHSPVLQLQRTLGNQRIAELVQAKRLTPEGRIVGLQPKLTVGAADDQYEQEADRMARQVTTMPEPVGGNSAQRAISPEEEDKEETVQAKPLAESITPFVQRQAGGDEELEENETPVQAKLAAGVGESALQRQPSAEEEKEREMPGVNEPIQRKCAACDESGDNES